MTYRVEHLEWHGKGTGWFVTIPTGLYTVVHVAGPFEHKNTALMEANLRASEAPGNRVES
jgi:hypothetical protein